MRSHTHNVNFAVSMCIRRTHFVIRYNNIVVSPLSNRRYRRCRRHHLARKSFLYRVEAGCHVNEKKITTYERQSVACVQCIKYLYI